MGEAKRRAEQGLGPRATKPTRPRDNSPWLVPWLPLTQRQTQAFMKYTTTGAWVGIGLLVVLWLVVRFVGPAAGWWNLAG